MLLSFLTGAKSESSTSLVVGQHASKLLGSDTPVEVEKRVLSSSIDTRNADDAFWGGRRPNSYWTIQVGVRSSSHKKVTGAITQLNFIYINARTTDNKQEELEACTTGKLLYSHHHGDMVGQITEVECCVGWV